MTRTLVAVAVAVVATAAPPSVVLAHGRVTSLAQDAGRIAWADGSCGTLHVRVVATGRESVFAAGRMIECQNGVGDIAVAGSRVLWTATSGGNDTYSDVVTAAPGKKPKVLEEAISESGIGDGDVVTATAGDGPTLVYAVARVVASDPCSQGGGTCTLTTRTGHVTRVGGPYPTLRGVGAALLAASGTTVALVRADPTPQDERTFLAPGTTVELWDIVRRKHLATVDVGAPIHEIALARRELAVLVDGSIFRYAVPSLAERGQTAVPSSARDVSISSSGVVYRTGRAIRLLGRAKPLALAATPDPVGLSIESARVAWAEASRGRSRIRLLRLR